MTGSQNTFSDLSGSQLSLMSLARNWLWLSLDRQACRALAARKDAVEPCALPSEVSGKDEIEGGAKVVGGVAWDPACPNLPQHKRGKTCPCFPCDIYSGLTRPNLGPVVACPSYSRTPRGRVIPVSVFC